MLKGFSELPASATFLAIYERAVNMATEYLKQSKVPRLEILFKIDTDVKDS